MYQPFLKNKATIRIATTCLNRIQAICKALHPETKDTRVPEVGAGWSYTRMFIFAYSIVNFPQEIFDYTGRPETILSEAATQLLSAFESMLLSIHEAPRTSRFQATEHTRRFQSLLFRYYERFYSWKIPNDLNSIRRVKATLVSLYEIDAKVDPEDRAQRRGVAGQVCTHIELLRSKLHMLAGPAALHQFDQEHPAMHLRESNTHEQQPAEKEPSSQQKGKPLNEVLAHELILNPSYQLNPNSKLPVNELTTITSSTKPSRDQEITDIMHRTFWKCVVDDLLFFEAPSYRNVLEKLREVFDIVKEYTTVKIADEMDQLIDFAHIKHQADHGMLSWADSAALVRTFLDFIQRSFTRAPRVAETRAQWAPIQVHFILILVIVIILCFCLLTYMHTTECHGTGGLAACKRRSLCRRLEVSCGSRPCPED